MLSCPAWLLVIVFVGVGVGQVFAISLVTTYYVAIMGITLKYMFESFKSVLPWSVCDEEWLSLCISSGVDNSTSATRRISSSLVNANVDLSHLNGSTQRTASAELYFM